jgi:hypothetical protein
VTSKSWMERAKSIEKSGMRIDPLAPFVTELISDLAAREKERDDLKVTRSILTDRAQTAEGLVRRAVEFAENCQVSHNTAFAMRAEEWLKEIPRE